jgi:DNA-binding CsgD family transcriptional regulator
MPTLSEAAAAFEEQHFTGRERELAVFQQWLSCEGQSPTILSVSGPGGTGKSALLRAFARLAHVVGRPVVVADGELAPLTPAALLQMLATIMESDEVTGAEHAQPVLLIDAYDRRPDLWRSVLEEFLPTLNSSLRVVVAGRSPLQLTWNRYAAYHRLIQPLPLQRFTEWESGAYLERLGIRDLQACEQIISATGGNPLALSLAADLVLKFEVRDLAAAPQWHLNVHALLEHILQEVTEPHIRMLLDVFAVAHQVDEAALVSIAENGDGAGLFDKLCRLSVLRPAEHGLSMHEDVRRLLAQDLHWRQPLRYAALVERALAHFEERAIAAQQVDAGWLLSERLHVSPNRAAAALVFHPDDTGQVSVGPARANDSPALERLWAEYLARTMTPDERGLSWDQDVDREFLGELLRYPAARVCVARVRDGQPLGFSTAVPVWRESLALLNRHPAFGQLVRAWWGSADLAALPATLATSDILFFVHMAHSTELVHAVRSGLLRAQLSHLAPPGRYLACSPFLADHAAFVTLGFKRVGGARTTFWGDAHPGEGFVLDLKQRGIARWLETVDRGECAGPALSDNDPLERLTPRERDIVLLLARGRTTNRALAAELFITTGTANLHVKHILNKLGLATRAQVAAWAADVGLAGAALGMRSLRRASPQRLIPFPAVTNAALQQQNS